MERVEVGREDTNLELVLPRFGRWRWVEEIDCENLDGEY